MDRIGQDVDTLIEAVKRVEKVNTFLVQKSIEQDESIKLLHAAILRLEKPSMTEKLLKLNGVE